MIEAILGSTGAERVLLYLENYGEGYPTEIARTFGMAQVAIQRQLQKFEDGGIVVSRLIGRTRLYTWNPRFPLLKPLRELLRAALREIPQEETKKFFRKRRRPRKSGKPL